MRSVNNRVVPRPSALNFDDKNSTGYKELVSYKDSLKEGLKFSFGAYKCKEVKYALEKLFHGKCAYCESIYVHTHPGDVEHFRPKGRVTSAKKYVNDGYFWLAGCWENLLPSCIDCNRLRNVQLVTVNNQMYEGSTGKANEFRLFDESQRVSNFCYRSISNKKVFSSVASELPILLNPRFDDVEDYFDYTDDAVIFVSKDVTDPILFNRADESIRLYGLNRANLVFVRKELVLTLFNYINFFKELIVTISQGDLNEKSMQVFSDFSISVLKVISDFRRPERAFSSMSKKIIERELAEYF